MPANMPNYHGIKVFIFSVLLRVEATIDIVSGLKNQKLHCLNSLIHQDNI